MSHVPQLFDFSFVPLWISSQLKIGSWRTSCRIWRPRRSRLPTGKPRSQRSFSGACAPRMRDVWGSSPVQERHVGLRAWVGARAGLGPHGAGLSQAMG